jgi:hypothetical protein
MNRRLFTSLKLSLAASVMLAMGAAQAHAADTKIYAGAECVRGYFSGGSLVYVSGSVFNDSTTSALDVDCPVIHDSKNNFIQSGKVRVVDQNVANTVDSNVSCTLSSAYWSESNFTSVSTPRLSNSASFDSRAQYIQFGSPNQATAELGATIQNASTLGHHYIACRIPRKFNNFVSYIDSYQVTEIGGNE